MSDRRQIWTFLTLLLLISGFFYARVHLGPDSPKQWGSYAALFMWCPGLAAVLTKLAWERSLRGLGWGWGWTRYFLIAYGLAITVCLIAYLPVWLACDAFSRGRFAETIAQSALPPALRRGAGLILFVLVLSPLAGLISAAGEEIGWRGFLVPRMHARFGFTVTSLAVGLLWAAWHYPINAAVLPIHRPNVPLWYANACFTVAVVGVSFAQSWLRAVFHATGNALQSALQAATLETGVTSYLTTEYGISFAIAGCVLGALFWRKQRRQTFSS